MGPFAWFGAFPMRRVPMIAAAVGSLLVAAPAWAAGEEVGPIPTVLQGMVPALTALIVFTVVLLVLGTLVWPKILKGLNDRADKIEQEIKAAEDARLQAKEALAQYQQSLAEARAEAKGMLEKARAEQAKFAAELKAKNESELSAMRERALHEISQARKAAVAELYTEAANLATHMAGKILGRELNAGDQQSLVEESLRELSARRN